MKQTNNGFTLIELMIVIAIIGILAGIAYPSYTGFVKKANRADAIDSLLVLSGRMEEFYMNGLWAVYLFLFFSLRKVCILYLFQQRQRLPIQSLLHR